MKSSRGAKTSGKNVEEEEEEEDSTDPRTHSLFHSTAKPQVSSMAVSSLS